MLLRWVLLGLALPAGVAVASPAQQSVNGTALVELRVAVVD
jgi:hypothetical protein